MNYETRDVLKTYSGKHMYTNDETLKQRCFQVKMIDFRIDVQIVYIVTLLEHGYKLVDDMTEDSTSIQFLRNINGESVDWTYGAALFMVLVYILK